MVPALAAIAGLVARVRRRLPVPQDRWRPPTRMSIEARAQKLLLDSRREADAARPARPCSKAKDEVASMRREAEDDLRGRRDELARQERRMGEAETDLKAKVATVDARDGRAGRNARRSSLTSATQLEKATELHRAAAGEDRRHDVVRGPGPARGPGRGRREARGHDPGPRDRAAGAGGRAKSGPARS